MIDKKKIKYTYYDKIYSNMAATVTMFVQFASNSLAPRPN